MCFRSAFIFAVFLHVAVLAASAAVNVPQWLLDAVSRLASSYPPDSEAVVLLDEQATVVSLKGTLVTTGRRATKVLRPGSIEEVRRLVRLGAYDTKVRSVTGWVVNRAEGPRQVSMKNVIISSLAPDTMYMDAKLVLLIVPEVAVGSVVGFEWEEEHTPPSLEDRFQFQGRFPVLRARYSLTLPRRWAAKFHAVNWDSIEPQQNPADVQTTIIEIANVPAIADEPFKPSDHALAGGLIVRITPPARDSRAFAGWQDLGAWYDVLSRERRLPEETVTRKAGELISRTGGSLSKIRALADFVQREIRYVSIQIGIGGFQPHAAASVLANRYGDCKDKATLLGAMLWAVGIDSYPIIIHTDRGAVSSESPVSLYSFNHAILAIQLPDDVSDEGLDSVVRHPRLGRLLVFDPTMPTTPLGRLPSYLQDNTAFLVTEGGGELIRLPRAGFERNLVEQTGRLVLTSDGTLIGDVRELRQGTHADALRYLLQTGSEEDRRKHLETSLSLSLASFFLKDFKIMNLDKPEDDLVISFQFIAPGYAKRTGGYLVVRPRVLGQKAVNLASRKKGPRRYPIDLETTILARDEFAFELPEGYVLESMPDPVALDAGFAAYQSTLEAAGRTLTYRREYRLVEPVLPASRFDEALAFYLAVMAEEQQSVLLKTADIRRP